MICEELKDKKIVIGMSGGVDSSVAGYLLKQAGCDVTAVFMNNWEETGDSGACTAAADYEDAKSVCLKLGIPFYAVNFAAEYKQRVFSYFLEEYRLGRTPNPDILCNSEIKFKAFTDYARRTFGACLIATGHYAGLRRDINGRAHLIKAADTNKDQSYFLCALTEEQLSGAVFPLQDMHKPRVREIAASLGLRTAEKKDSTGICFIGERDFAAFLSQYLPAQPGDTVDIDTGRVIARHNGLMYYTVGQRKGLGIGNLGGGERWFVCEKDTDKNILYVAEGAENPRLFRSGFVSYHVHLVRPDDPPPESCAVKYRYRQQEKPARVEFFEGGARIIFAEKQSGIAPGQVGAFYSGDECFGSAVIDEVMQN